MNFAVLVPLAVLLLWSTWMVLRARTIFSLIVFLSVLSGVIAALYALLGAPDVAFTEAVVGVSISTVFLVMVAPRWPVAELAGHGPARRVTSAAIVGLVGTVLVAGIGALPPFGDPTSAMQRGIASAYASRSLADMATPNVVTAVLADYRGFDTLIETAVVVAAAVACLLVSDLAGPGSPDERTRHVFDSVILRTLMAPMTASMQLFAVYVVLHGHYSPGGGFQGGVILAASLILPQLVDRPNRRYPTLNAASARQWAAFGVLMFAAFAAAPLLVERPMLDYAALPLGEALSARRAWGILGIEISVMLAVAGAIVAIFDALRAKTEAARP